MRSLFLMIMNLVVMALVIIGCADDTLEGSGQITSDPRPLPLNVREVTACCGVIVTVEIGEESRAEVVGDDNIVALVDTRFSGSQAFVELVNVGRELIPTRPIEVRFTLLGLRGLHGTGGASLSTVGAIESDRVAVTLDESSTATLSGTSQTLDATLSGGSTLSATELSAQSVALTLSGGSSANVTAESTLEISASGGSRVTWRGGATLTGSSLSEGSTVSGP